MLNKDKRSMALSLILGDGNLYVNKQNYGRMTIDHGIGQADYQAWKASLLSDIFERDVKVRTGHKGNSVQIQVSDRRLRAWKKFTYPSNKKDIARILPFIRHPEMALAIWLMDDGYVEPSKNKKAPNSLSARFRLFTCDQNEITQQKIIEWFKINFDVNVKIKQAWHNKQQKHYPYLKLNQEDSLKIWEKIREFVLQFKSMQHKFRYIEQVYQLRIVQRVPDRRFKSTSDDIVRAPSNSGKYTSKTN